MPRLKTLLLLLVLSVGTRAANAQASAPMSPDMPMPPAATTALATNSDVEVSLSTAVEDGKKQLIATVKLKGKPLEKATVSFGAKRTFGRLVLGSDVTLDDGTAAIPFPTDLPGGPTGELELNAMVQGPLSKWGAAADATFPGGRPRTPLAENFPRALWAPTAPVGLIAVIALLVGAAWSTYLFVAFQLMSIRKGSSP